MNWILASGSPRRRELLEMLGVPDLTIRPAKGPERATPGAGPEQTVRELSLHKAQEVAQTCAPEDIIIAADTIVYLDGAILGKPRDHDDAVRMLTALSGRLPFSRQVFHDRGVLPYAQHSQPGDMHVVSQ